MLDQAKDAKASEATVERFESINDDEMQGKGITPPGAMGTVTITDLKEIYLVPAPSADPQGRLNLETTWLPTLTHRIDPLNMPKWRKIVFIVLMSMCKLLKISCFSCYPLITFQFRLLGCHLFLASVVSFPSIFQSMLPMVQHTRISLHS
jgi:hypothetical protein